MTYQPIYEEKYIPDMSTWTNIGEAPFCSTRIIKINNTLYAFGCYIVNASSSKIFSTAWNNPTGWADTGVTVSGFGNDSCIGIIGDTIYCYVNNTNGSHVLTAPISTPLTWSDTGIHLTATSRDNCAFIVTPTHICMCGGYRGGAGGNITFAPIATPTTFGTGATMAGWQQGGCYLDSVDAHVFGGSGVTGTVWSFINNNPAKLTFGPSTVPAYVSDYQSSVFHVENRIYITGANNQNLYHANADNLHVPWDVHTAVMPANVTYPSANWIGPDGYAYMINQIVANPPIYRSGRKKIYVIDPPANNGNYSHRYAVTETGGSSLYTIQCQMGMAPWFTNRRDKF